MASNTLVKAAGFGLGDEFTSAQAQDLQIQAARSVNRANTFSGWRAMPMALRGSTSCEMRTNASGQLVTSGTTGHEHAFDLIGLPNGHTLTAVRMWIMPANQARGGVAPGNLPNVSLYKTRSWIGSVTPTQIGATVTATWGSEAAYEAGQDLTISGFSETIDLDSYTYLIVFYGESGANSFNGLIVPGISAQVTIAGGYGVQDLTHWRTVL